MKWRIFYRGSGFFFLLVFIITGLFSCRTAREIPEARLKPISTGRLLRSVEKNTFGYDDLTIRRINCRFSSIRNKANFGIRLEASKDEKILVSIKKMNIPVGRVLLTPDSVKYVNYIDHNFFVDDYSYLSDFLNIDLDFESIQSILSNDAFSYRNDSKQKDFRTFDTSIDSGMYLLQSEKEQKILNLKARGKEGKARRLLQRYGEESVILQRMYFHPRDFTLRKLIISDISRQRQMEMVFDDFEKVEKNDFPGLIEMNVTSPRDVITLKIKMNGFSTEKIDRISLRIPEKYEQIHVN